MYNGSMKTIPQHTLDFIDSWLALRAKWDDAPGFVVAISKNGKTIFNQAYGLADEVKNQPMTTGHVFRIASHSKSFTATAVMQLQEAGKLRIDDPVANYIDWLNDHRDTRWQDVTIRQLLSHSAGVIRDGLDSAYWQLSREFPDKDNLRKAVLAADLINEPNEKMKYSNYGYSLLGLVIEAASDMTYEAYISQYIFQPLKLKQTTTDHQEELMLATGYSRPTLMKTRVPFPHRSTNAMAAATGFCATAEDLMAFFNAHRIGSGLLLSDASKREMQRKQWEVSGQHGDAYGLGLDVVRHGKRKLIGHSGGFPGYITRTWLDGEDGLAVVVLCNAHATRPGIVAKAIIDIIDKFGEESPKAEHLKFEERFAGMHGAYQVVAHADGLSGIWPNSWWPLDGLETLERVDDTTLKITDANGFGNQGEYIQFTFKDSGAVKYVVHGGSIMRPSADGDFIKTWE